MKPKRFWGRDMAEALRAVRSSLGVDALVLQTKDLSAESGGGVEITAVAEEPNGSAAHQVGAPLAAKPYVAANADAQPVEELRHEIGVLKSMLGWLAPGLNHQDKIVQTLVAHGIGPDLLARLAENKKRITVGDERERWYRAIAQSIPSGAHVRAKNQRLALIGPTGVGKTMSLIKLTIFETQRHGWRVGWIGADERRLRTGDPLAVYASVLGVPYEQADGGRSVKEALGRLSECDLVLIDTPGVNPRDPQSVKELKKMFHNLPEVHRTLLLSAGSNGSDMAEWVESFRQVGVHSLFFTKMDECRYFGALLQAMLRADLPASYIAMGQNLSGDLEIARPQVFASLLLTGVELHD